jgi:hypothetical protein
MRSISFLLLSTAVAVSCNDARERPAPAAPASDPFVERVLSSPGFLWSSVTTEHFIVHGVTDSYAGNQIASLGDAAEKARDVVLSQLGEGQTGPDRAHVFFVRGPDDFRALVGQPAGGWTEPAANAVLAAVSESAAPPFGTSSAISTRTACGAARLERG